MKYSWAQFSAYLHLAKVRRARQRLEGVVDNSNAFAGGENAGKLVRGLSDQAED